MSRLSPPHHRQKLRHSGQSLSEVAVLQVDEAGEGLKLLQDLHRKVEVMDRSLGEAWPLVEAVLWREVA